MTTFHIARQQGGAVASLRRITGAGTDKKHSMQRQSGFSLIEVSIVTAIILLLAIIAIPAVGAYVVENKVPRVGEELARFVLQTQVNAQPGSSAPYSNIHTDSLASMVKDSTVLSVRDTGSSSTVQHGLGGSGTVTVSAHDSGASFSMTLDKVSQAACPALASVRQRIVDTITIGAEGGSSTVVKSDVIEYNALQAKSHCAKGNINTFVLTTS